MSEQPGLWHTLAACCTRQRCAPRTANTPHRFICRYFASSGNLTTFCSSLRSNSEAATAASPAEASVAAATCISSVMVASVRCWDVLASGCCRAAWTSAAFSAMPRGCGVARFAGIGRARAAAAAPLAPALCCAASVADGCGRDGSCRPRVHVGPSMCEPLQGCRNPTIWARADTQQTHLLLIVQPTLPFKPPCKASPTSAAA